MKYKKHITTGVLAFALIVSGTTAFALAPTDGSSNQITTTDKEVGKHPKLGMMQKSKKMHQIVGTVIAVNRSNFTVEVKNIKAKTTDTFDVTTTGTTTFTKDGKASTFADLAVAQKVIVSGTVDTVAKTVTATKVRMITSVPKVEKHVKKLKKIKDAQVPAVAPAPLQ